MSMADFNTQVINEFRENGGKVGGMFEHMPIILVHHVGARSGEARVAPLAYLQDGGNYAIFASKGGAPENPSWYHNLKASPHTTIELGDRTLAVVAEEAAGEERDRLFTKQAAAVPQFAGYQESTQRKIPVIVLKPEA
jgi:deazaflavin-dependent oxidoreductase (nitroreductase family)